MKKGVKMTNYDTLKEYEAHKEPLPSYEEWKTAKENLEKNGTWYTERSHNELLKQIERLQEQLSEANEVIKYYAEKHGKLKACDYLNKWGVK